MNHSSDSRVSLPPRPLPARATQPAEVSASLLHRGATTSPEFARWLERLVADESALFAITRDWRYESAQRKFVRLHALLDEQFTEIGRRLVTLAACRRDLDLGVSPEPAATVPARPAPADRAPEEQRVRDLLARHEALLVRLREGQAMTAGYPTCHSTTELLATLIAEHEKDAFMLRALLWEVQNIPT